MKKVVRIVKEEGITGLFKRGKNKLLRKKHNFHKDLKMLEKIFSQNYKKVIIFENNFGWSKIMKQRPQQIASNFGDDVLFIYGSSFEEYKKDDSRIKKLTNNLYLMDLNVYRKNIIKLLKNESDKYLMLYSTDYVEQYIVNKYTENKFFVVYDYVDNIDKELCSPHYYQPLLDRREEFVNSSYSLLSCTASKLYDNIKEINKDAIVELITNGVDYEYFHDTKLKKISTMEDIKKEGKCIIGYYGALASWFDYNLINKIAKNKDNIVVLIGVDFDETIEKSKILDNDNVIYLGEKKYDELVHYASYFDIAVIPFIVNEITKATNPVKLFEYMALSKPIVTTDLPECKKYKSPFVSKNHDEFLKNLELAKKKIADKEYIALLNKEAKENSWKNKCEQFDELMENNKSRLVPQKIKNKLLRFIVKVFKYLKWHLIDKNKMYLKTWFKELFDVKTKAEYKEVISKIMNEHQECEKIFIWISNNFGWNVGLFQRPQHIAMNIANENILYFYDTSNRYDGVKTIKKQDDNLFLVNTSNKLFFKLLLKELKKTKKKKYIHIYSTEIAMPLHQLKKYIKQGFNVLYEYIDDLSPQISGTEELPKHIVDKYEYCLQDIENTAIVVTADDLEKDVMRFRNKSQFTYSCNGVNYDHFQVEKNYNRINRKMKEIVDAGKPIIGYYGALASWFDYEMVKYLAKERPEYNIILIGVKYDHYYDQHDLEEYENIHYLGTIDYKDLPKYAVYFDICTIPFLINEITQATSPLKLFEYMAMHKPIITTSMHECKKYKSVFIANDNKEFVELTDKCLQMNPSKDKAYFDLLEQEARDNTWQKKAKIILDYLDEFEKNNKVR